MSRPLQRSAVRRDLPGAGVAAACAVLAALWVAGARAIADEATSRLPARLVIIGDSTVKNGGVRAGERLWGWGEVLPEHSDSDRLEIENRALGGRSSRTYLTEGHWGRALQRLRKGDFLLIQFGHNDGGTWFAGDRPRASIKGNGDEAVDGVVEQTGQRETVRSYGWYLRKFIADAKARGAVPIVLSPVPRNRWQDGRVIRAYGDYGKWASEAAAGAGAHFVDLNRLVARRYDALGEQAVARDFFVAGDTTHTTRAGAAVTAACLVEGLRNLRSCDLRDHLRQHEGAPRR